MSMQSKLQAERREDVGKGASRRLRRAGRLPAIVYGGERDPVSLTLDHDIVLHNAEHEAFFSSILELNVGKLSQKVIVRDLQRHPFKPRLTHIDFQRVDEEHELRLNVPIHFANEASSKAGRAAGVVISHQITEVEISALPKHLPEYLEVDLSGLEPGDSVMLSEVPLPEGVSIPALDISSDNDAPVVTAIYIRESQGTGALAAEADAVLAEAEEMAALDVDEGEVDEDAEAEGEQAEDDSDDSASDEKKS